MRSNIDPKKTSPPSRVGEGMEIVGFQGKIERMRRLEKETSSHRGGESLGDRKNKKMKKKIY
jgi:hypothetical protein